MPAKPSINQINLTNECNSHNCLAQYHICTILKLLQLNPISKFIIVHFKAHQVAYKGSCSLEQCADLDGLTEGGVLPIPDLVPHIVDVVDEELTLTAVVDDHSNVEQVKEEEPTHREHHQQVVNHVIR